MTLRYPFIKTNKKSNNTVLLYRSPENMLLCCFTKHVENVVLEHASQNANWSEML
jgi:hypothetical protein